ncbi:hypothetical protein D1646_09695 [Pseudoflavonifractor sp. 60]|uniref:hypothetical protein n=1 Tax=Pseudoflavonifractor sp. 60 TaxID=2304576 RepID=UPI00136AFC31|nr:hypothetical protein [Pseudoflavonifractor sp. 60]NBI67087.1 hypothetical protein [Pseudoflavonifractor sp. 60]
MGRFRRIISFCIIASIIFSCMAYTFAYNGQDIHDSASSSTSTSSAEELEYISNLGTEKYNYLLDVWREDGAYSRTQDISYPSFYGGCYEDDNKDFVIMVTSLDQEVIDYFENLIDLNYVRFSLVENSYQELLDGKATIKQLLSSGAFGESITKLFTGTGISQRENAVNVYLATEDIAAIRDTIEQVYAANTYKPCKLRFISAWYDVVELEASEPNEQDDFQQPYLVNGAFVEPGGPIRVNGVPLSVGFWAKDYLGNLGIVTANHGRFYDGLEAYASKAEDGSTATAYFGKVTSNTWYGGSVDASFVRRMDNRFGVINYVSGWDFYLKSETIDMKEGQEIFKKGIASGATRGKVIELGFDPSSVAETDSKLTSVVLTDCYAQPYDSGGIVAGGGSTSSRYIAGIIHAGAYRVSSSGAVEGPYMMFSQASDILKKIRVTLP